MKSIVSHTLVRNGMPFIDLVLRQVIPFVNRSLVTISEKSSDGTLQQLRKLENEFKNKIIIDFENVAHPSMLTHERQKQVDKTFEDWVFFLDDDDYWPTESLEKMMRLLEKDEDVDAYSVTPYQLIDQYTHDVKWKDKSFTKWFRNKDIIYHHPWPRDLIYKGDELLYWRKNSRVPRIDIPFFHLSYIKGHSFRTEDWAKSYAHQLTAPLPIPEEMKKYVWEIYDQFNKFSR